MIKTFNINLAGQIFNINEDAYEHLSQYFNSLRSFYANEEDKDEIIRDIESRFAELFLAKGKNYIVTKQDADEVVTLMGNPQEFDEENAQQSTSSSNTNTNANTSNSTVINKKLYRDADSGLVTGVCAGLSAYFGIADPIWLRLLFIVFTIFGFGSPILLYIILSIVMPKAETATQKLEMKGEPINLSNIEKKIKDDTFLEKPKGTLNKIMAAFGAGILILLKILMWFGIAIAVITVGSIVFALLIALLVFSVIGIVGIPFANTFFFTNNSDGWLLGLGGLLIGIIPIIFVIVALVHIFSKTIKPLTKKFIFPTVGLFFFGLLLINISAFHAKKLVQEKKKINQTFPLNYNLKSDTIQIAINPSIKDEDYNDININGIGDLVEFLSDHNDKIIPVKIEIFQSANDSFYVVKEYSANGKTDKDAIQNATSFTHNITQVNNKILIDPYLQFDMNKTKFRNQKLRIKVYVPEGKIIKWDRRTEEYIDMKNLSINWDDIKYPNVPTPPAPPTAPNAPNSSNQNHNIVIKTNKKGDSTTSKISINIDSNNPDVNEALDKAQEKIDEAREKLENASTIDIEEQIDSSFEASLHRQHYIFRMVNGELVPID